MEASDRASKDSLGAPWVEPPPALDLYSPEGDDPMAEIRPVSQIQSPFTDIPPDHWALKAVEMLSQKYKLLQGYPDGTFRGTRPMSRYEFASVLAQFLEDFQAARVSKYEEDLKDVQRLTALQAEIKEQLQKRVGELEAQNSTLKAQQFSTTTRLSGQTVLNFTDGSGAKGSLVNRTRLGLTAYFPLSADADSAAIPPINQLVMQMEFGNGKRDAIAAQQSKFSNLLGTVGVLADGGGLDAVQVPEDLRFNKLYYSFTPHRDWLVTVGAKLSPRDLIDKNAFANDSATNFATSFFANNPLTVQNPIDRNGGAGLAVQWQRPNSPLILRALYIAADASRPQRGLGEGVEIPSGPILLPPGVGETRGGLFGDRYQWSVEAEYALRSDITLRAQFTHAEIHNTVISALGLNGEWRINQQYGAFARLGWADYEGFNTLLLQKIDARPFTWAIGATARDLLFPGTLAGIALGQPFNTSRIGSSIQTNLEAFYQVKLNDRVSVTPGLIFVDNPDNQDKNLIFQWYLRVVYAF
jgi:Carbohydrate-selective porin, OprB family/S-layer homology domain